MEWFEPPDLDRPGRLPHQQGPCEVRLGYQDESPRARVQNGSPVENFVQNSPCPPHLDNESCEGKSTPHRARTLQTCTRTWPRDSDHSFPSTTAHTRKIRAMVRFKDGSAAHPQRAWRPTLPPISGYFSIKKLIVDQACSAINHAGSRTVLRQGHK